MCQWRVLLVLLVRWEAAGLRNYVYQKDMSEYCRRHAMPSVFLSRHVMETNAQMLHFSKLDLPYGCYTSIRTESSSNIIMVIQLVSGLELESACQRCGNQLLVYEFGETFGGYWGPMPEAVMRPSPVSPQFIQPYTLPTTKPPTTATEEDDSEDESFSLVPETTTAAAPRPRDEDDDDNFIRIEVPLVNFSGNLVPAGAAKVDKAFLEDDAFDFMYDVTPRRGVQYETSILPLVQMSVRPETDHNGRRDSNDEARYELDLDFGTFTPDYRLTMPFLSTRSRVGNRNRNLWKGKKLEKKRFKWKGSSSPLFSKESGAFDKPNKYTLTTNQNKLSSTPVVSPNNSISHNEAIKHTDNAESFGVIEDIMKFLNKGKDIEKQKPRLNQSYLPAIRNISDMHHNFSAYLLPWSTYTYIPVSAIFGNFTRSNNVSPLSQTTPFISTISLQTQKTNSAKNMTERIHTTNSHRNTVLEKVKGSASILLNDDKNKTSINKTKPTSVSPVTKSKHNTFSQISNKLQEIKVTESVTSATKDDITFASTETVERNFTGSLVDHESWENVVQAAPVMAVLLNQHAPHERPHLPLSNETHANFKTSDHAGRWRRRRRRSVDPIPIGAARPHTRRTVRPRATARTPPPQLADMQHFAQLLEIPDDEMSPHVALRFIRQYAGPLAYNICNQLESANKKRHVVLFNSSRIILAIDNFTISRMTVVVTTANALLSSEARCSEGGIECQVSGSRVCIDSTSACDGIPNCGAQDIYDEDRLQCGGSLGLQHSVSLAAITFMAVLLTTLCIVHYWLDRCVPRVADAFFIYTDSAENVLYLDTIMRSPTDVDSTSKYLYDGLFEENINEFSYDVKKPKSIWQRLISKFNFFKQKHKSCELADAGDIQKVPETRKVYSFTELELLNMKGPLKTDEAVQTGESLEMAFLKMINSLKQEKPAEVKMPPNTPRRRLSSGFPLIFQNIKDRTFNSPESSSSSPGPSMQESHNSEEGPETVEDEREIHSTLYETQGPRISFGETSKGTGTTYAAYARKRLRFDEQAMFIPIPEDEAVPPESHAALADRPSIVLGTGTTRPKRRNINSLEAISQDAKPPSSDYRRFFKGKGFRKKKEYK